MISTAWIFLWNNKGAISLGVLFLGLCILFGSLYAKLGIAEGKLALATAEATVAHARVAILESELKVQNVAVETMKLDSLTRQSEGAKMRKETEGLRSALEYAANAARERTVVIAPVPASSTITRGVQYVVTPVPENGCVQAVRETTQDLRSLK